MDLVSGLYPCFPAIGLSQNTLWQRRFKASDFIGEFFRATGIEPVTHDDGDGSGMGDIAGVMIAERAQGRADPGAP